MKEKRLALMLLLVPPLRKLSIEKAKSAALTIPNALDKSIPVPIIIPPSPDPGEHW